MEQNQAATEVAKLSVRDLPRFFLTGLVLLMPLKFGSLLASTDVPIFPVSVWDWAFAAWSPWLFPAVAGLALLLTVLLSPVPDPAPRLWLVPGLWAALLLSALLGLVRTTEWDAALLFLWHLLGIWCLTMAVCWRLPADPKLRNWLFAAMTVGALLCALRGWTQRFGGLDETARVVQEMARAKGQTLAPEILERLQQRRAFSFFVYPNSFAAHLLLSAPIVILTLWRWGSRLEPVRVSRFVFVSSGTVLMLGALVFTESRAAFAALGAALVVSIVMLPALRRWRLPLAALCLLAAVLVMWGMSRTRSMASLRARAGYAEAAVRMWTAHPGAGVGLGEFFPHYMRLKPAAAEDTRLPHNLVLNLASQAGAIAGLAAAACLALPLLVTRLPLRTGTVCERATAMAILVGGVAWSIHSLADFNLHIPSTAAAAAMLPLLAVLPSRSRGTISRTSRYRVRILVAAVALVAIGALWRLPGEYRYEQLYRACRQESSSLNQLRRSAQAAAALLPLSPYPFAEFGRASERARVPGAAAAAYRSAARLTPHRSAFHAHLAAALLSLGRLDEAAAALEQATIWYPQNPDYVLLDVELRRRQQQDATD